MRVELISKSLVSSDCSTFSQVFSASEHLNVGDIRWACACAYLNREAWWAMQDFNWLQRSVLPLVLLVTVVPTAFISLKSSSCVVLGRYTTFLMIILTPFSKILHGAPEWGSFYISYISKYSHQQSSPSNQTSCWWSCCSLQTCAGLQACP